MLTADAELALESLCCPITAASTASAEFDERRLGQGLHLFAQTSSIVIAQQYCTLHVFALAKPFAYFEHLVYLARHALDFSCVCLSKNQLITSSSSTGNWIPTPISEDLTPPIDAINHTMSASDSTQWSYAMLGNRLRADMQEDLALGGLTSLHSQIIGNSSKAISLQILRERYGYQVTEPGELSRDSTLKAIPHCQASAWEIEHVAKSAGNV